VIVNSRRKKVLSEVGGYCNVQGLELRRFELRHLIVDGTLKGSIINYMLCALQCYMHTMTMLTLSPPLF